MSVPFSSFNVDKFDQKVAQIIVDIHRKSKGDVEFSEWVNTYYEHLEHLYYMTDEDITMEQFFTLIYDHS